MPSFYPEKKLLIEKLFESGQKTLRTEAKNSIADYFEILLKEEYGYEISARTLVRCYDNIYQGKNPEYKLKDDLGWDFLSKILNYKDFHDFCEKERDTLNTPEEDSILKEILKTLVSIKEVVTYALSHFTIKQSSWGIIGLLVAVGFLMSKSDYTQKSENQGRKIGFVSESLPKDESLNKTPVASTIIYVPQSERIKNSEKIFISERKKECMFWKNDHYEEVFCDEKIEGANVIALNEERLKLFRKIKSPDTLTAENAMGKIWYDKSDKKVEFFTYYGVHPTNGKTLKPVTPYILETYVQK